MALGTRRKEAAASRKQAPAEQAPTDVVEQAAHTDEVVAGAVIADAVADTVVTDEVVTDEVVAEAPEAEVDAPDADEAAVVEDAIEDAVVAEDAPVIEDAPVVEDAAEAMPEAMPEPEPVVMPVVVSPDPAEVAALRSSLGDLQSLVATLVERSQKPETTPDADVASRIIVAANRAAEATIDGARAEAEEMLAEAKARSMQIITAARDLAEQELNAERDRVAKATAAWEAHRADMVSRLATVGIALGGYNEELGHAASTVRDALDHLDADAIAMPVGLPDELAAAIADVPAVDSPFGAAAIEASVVEEPVLENDAIEAPVDVEVVEEPVMDAPSFDAPAADAAWMANGVDTGVVEFGDPRPPTFDTEVIDLTDAEVVDLLAVPPSGDPAALPPMFGVQAAATVAGDELAQPAVRSSLFAGGVSSHHQVQVQVQAPAAPPAPPAPPAPAAPETQELPRLRAGFFGR